MAYKVAYKESVERDLKGMDKTQRVRILEKVESDLADAPRVKGSPLRGKWKGLWRYEVRPYRVIYAIFEGDKTILVVRIGHRKEVYR